MASTSIIVTGRNRRRAVSKVSGGMSVNFVRHWNRVSSNGANCRYRRHCEYKGSHQRPIGGPGRIGRPVPRHRWTTSGSRLRRRGSVQPTTPNSSRFRRIPGRRSGSDPQRRDRPPELEKTSGRPAQTHTRQSCDRPKSAPAPEFQAGLSLENAPGSSVGSIVRVPSRDRSNRPLRTPQVQANTGPSRDRTLISVSAPGLLIIDGPSSANPGRG